MTPILLEGIKSIKNSFILFIIVGFIRILVEIFIRNGAFNILHVNFHRGPIIRCMEFYLGMLMCPFYFKIKFYLDIISNNFYFKIIYTLVQILMPIMYYIIMYKYNDILYRCYYVLIFCIFIFITSYDFGYISDIMSYKICKLIFSCQMEIYLLHNTINKQLNKIKFHRQYIRKYNLLFFDFWIKLIITFIIAYLYKLLLRGRLSVLMDEILNLFNKILD